MRWSEGHVHVAMRRVLKKRGWLLVAGEFPGGSDHELYPLNVVDPRVACDNSPDPRRHSLGELIPDLVALRGRLLLVAEAKVRYDSADAEKLALLVGERRTDLLQALEKFAVERRRPELLPVSTLEFRPTLVFVAGTPAPPVQPPFSYLRVQGRTSALFEGELA